MDRDLKNSLDTAKEEGKLEGLLEGKIEGIIEGEQIGLSKEKRETAFRGFEAGLDNRMISTLTGLSEEEVESIRREWLKSK